MKSCDNPWFVLVFFLVAIVALLPFVNFVYAQTSSIQQANQNGVVMQFEYSPSSPTIDNYTTLMFSVINSTTGKPVQNYVGSVTVSNVAGFTGGSGYYNFSKIEVTNGSFSVNYAFPNDGLFPIFFRADYPTSIYGPGSPIAIAEFKVIVPPPQVIPGNNTTIYVGIGIVVAVGCGITMIILMKRKPINQ